MQLFHFCNSCGCFFLQVLLLDEITVDLDVVGRMHLLDFFRRECEERGATIVYATHIFDGLENWITHLAYMEDGRFLRGGEGSSASWYLPVVVVWDALQWCQHFLQKSIVGTLCMWTALACCCANGCHSFPWSIAQHMLSAKQLTIDNGW